MGLYSLIAPYLGWIVAVVAVLTLSIVLLMYVRRHPTIRYRRGHVTAWRADETQAQKYLALLAKLDQMHERGEINEAYYLKLKREYEEKLGP